jgi:hypothetical protein
MNSPIPIRAWRAMVSAFSGGGDDDGGGGGGGGDAAAVK